MYTVNLMRGLSSLVHLQRFIISVLRITHSIDYINRFINCMKITYNEWYNDSITDSLPDGILMNIYCWSTDGIFMSILIVF